MVVCSWMQCKPQQSKILPSLVLPQLLSGLVRVHLSMQRRKAVTCSHLMRRFIYLFGILFRFQQCTGHITTGSWKGRGNQYIQFVRVLYCKLPTNGKQLLAFPLEAMPGTEPRLQRWEARVLPLCTVFHQTGQGK